MFAFGFAFSDFWFFVCYPILDLWYNGGIPLMSGVLDGMKRLLKDT
jgi:hypothetical protein